MLVTLKGQLTQITKGLLSILPLELSSQGNCFGFICLGFEISVSMEVSGFYLWLQH